MNLTIGKASPSASVCYFFSFIVVVVVYLNNHMQKCVALNFKIVICGRKIKQTHWNVRIKSFILHFVLRFFVFRVCRMNNFALGLTGWRVTAISVFNYFSLVYPCFIYSAILCCCCCHSVQLHGQHNENGDVFFSIQGSATHQQFFRFPFFRFPQSLIKYVIRNGRKA